MAAVIRSHRRSSVVLLRSVVAVAILALVWQDFSCRQTSYLIELQKSAAIHYEDLQASSSAASKDRRKVVLLGPHDRFNFGDLLFEKVVSKLLVDRAGYRPDDLIRAGIVTTDMSAFGGPSSIFSLKTIQKLSFASSQNNNKPYDIIYLGGEAARCPHNIGVRMLHSRTLQESAREDKVYDCAYLLPKEELIPPNYMGPSNLAVVNAMGRVTAIPSCQRAIDSADYRSFRNPPIHENANEKLVPDSAVMTRTLFGSHVENLDNFPDIQEIVLAHGDYIAVQHKERGLADDLDALAAVLDSIATENNHSAIVFFAAGTVKWHDSFNVYHRLADKLQARTFVLDQAPNVWKVVATVAHAKVVLSTSLHVRIMAFQFQKPRVTWCEDNEKHSHFIQSWEQLDDDHDNNTTICVSWNQTAAALRRSLPMDAARVQTVTEAYLASFDEWSHMLLHGHRTNVTRRMENNESATFW